MEQFKHLTPTKLGYCLKGNELRQKNLDKVMWSWWGNYGLSAISVAVEHNLFGKKAKSKYIDKPIMEEEKKQGKLTEEEKQRQVDLFFAREKARRIGWKRNHKNTSINTGASKT